MGLEPVALSLNWRSDGSDLAPPIIIDYMERTFAIIKPDAVKKGQPAGSSRASKRPGFASARLRMIHMSKREAEGFYYVHRERPFSAG